MSLRQLVRATIPLAWRQQARHALQAYRDRRAGRVFSTAVELAVCERPIEISQPIVQSNFYENKVINISRGAALLSGTAIPAGELWSFWHRILRPSASNGFVQGRNLVNGELVAQTGGGLCQLSSLVYHLALCAGLQVVERHPHSVDIYEEHQRFTPLGADATVVWGFKDVRLFNPHPFAVHFQFKVEGGRLIGQVHAAGSLQAQVVDFERMPIDAQTSQVNALINGEVTATTIYTHRPSEIARSL